jgi:hypothetical protein
VEVCVVIPKTSRRKQTFVNARVQGRFLGRIAAYWVLYHIVLWHGLFVYRYAQMRLSATAGHGVDPFRSIYWQFCIDYSPLLVCSLVIMPLFMLDFARMTHRFVGPLVRVRETLLQLMENERVANVEFRKGDLLPELQVAFNDFLSFYDEQRKAAAREESGLLSNAEVHAVSSVLSAERRSEAVEASV